MQAQPENEEPDTRDGHDVSGAGAHATLATASVKRRLRVFIVEDNPLIREELPATLEELAHVTVVGTAADERTAVQWMNDPAHGFDLANVDIFLRAGSGLGVLRRVAGNPPPHRLVVLSNYATDDVRTKCLELGAAAVFDKSNDIEALLQYCNELAGFTAPHGGAPAV